MRSQPRTWASRICASRRGDSTPFWARNCSVHWSRAPIVHTRSAMVLQRPQALLLVVVLQRPDQFVEVTQDDRVELVKGQVNAVVGEAVLREIVGADALVAVAG